jgi:hypothetical protein
MCAAPAVTSRPRYRSAFDGWHSLLPRDAMSAHALRSYNPDTGPPAWHPGLWRPFSCGPLAAGAVSPLTLGGWSVPLRSPGYWRARAEEARTIAEGMDSSEALRAMLQIAALYDELADKSKHLAAIYPDLKWVNEPEPAKDRRM